jgi:hypothetical protein
MTCPTGAAAEIERLNAQIARLRAALEPFAEAAELIAAHPDGKTLPIFLRMCRAAARALEP